jgi:hypothetical protein
MSVSWNAVSTFWMEADVTSIPPVLGDGGTQAGDILIASVYGDDPDGFTPPTGDWERISGPDVSGDLIAELWQLVITADMGTSGDMSGETLTWTQGVTGSLGCNIMALHTDADPTPCRVLESNVRTETTASTTHAAPTITTTEESVPLIFGAHRLGSAIAVPTGWTGIDSGNDGDHIGGVASVLSEGLAATTDYTPGDFTGASTAEAVTYTVAVVDTVAVDPVDPDPVELPTSAFESQAFPLDVDDTGTPPTDDSEVELPTTRFKFGSGVLTPNAAPATTITINVVDVASEDQGVMDVAAQLQGGTDTWILDADTTVLTDEKVWKFDTNGIHEIELIPNAAIEAIGMTPGQTFYRISLGRRRQMEIVVPVSNDPVTLRHCRDLYLARAT